MEGSWSPPIFCFAISIELGRLNGMETHFSSGSSLSGCHSKISVYFPFGRSERISNFWIRFKLDDMARRPPGLISPCLVLAVVGDSNIKETKIPPPLSRVSCRVPPSYIIDVFPYPPTSFMSDATLEGLKKVFVRRVGHRYCGVFIQYEDTDRPPAALGQWATPELRVWDHPGDEMAPNSEKACIYDSTKATPSIIVFKINWVYCYAYGIFFCNRDSDRLKLDPDSDAAKRTKLKAFDVVTRLSWWFMHNHDFIIAWKDDTPRQSLRVSEDHLIKGYIMEGDP
ncbi:hypothetical protein EYC80_007111 [Monilinia laxa]|uniref:Uncharacterized protein n=1 Tax=Monilinia laxa TaxID=61186 RepID=A0A5N6K093_MONLA|nr:hypothetical protein EYC80_007111 [Monilinia laxa]